MVSWICRLGGVRLRSVQSFIYLAVYEDFSPIMFRRFQCFLVCRSTSEYHLGGWPSRLMDTSWSINW